MKKEENDKMEEKVDKKEDIIDEEKLDKKEEKIDVESLNYEILLEDFSYFDLSFKVIVIGNSGNTNYIFYIIK